MGRLTSTDTTRLQKGADYLFDLEERAKRGELSETDAAEYQKWFPKWMEMLGAYRIQCDRETA